MTEVGLNVVLSVLDVKNLLAIINGAQIKGDTAETIVLLKKKLITVLPKVAPVAQEPQKAPAKPVAPAA